jgi:hypothetical protein
MKWLAVGLSGRVVWSEQAVTLTQQADPTTGNHVQWVASLTVAAAFQDSTSW